VREGIGLSNTRARLRQLYDSRQSLVLENLPGGGLEVTMLIPFRAAGSEEL
jgi:sensor histidine kinase YesM